MMFLEDMKVLLQLYSYCQTHAQFVKK